MATFHVLTANVQSFPRDAITLAQAREDLRANAADGDLVLLQEIDPRYRRIVEEEFPGDTWHVFFGPRGNHSPVAVRTALFEVLHERTIVIHPGVAKLHERRYLTHVHLRHRGLGTDLHVVNVHLTPGAFHKPAPPDAAARQAEWHDGMRKHDRFVADLVATGAPVIGGGDYNRRLRSFREQVRALSPRPVCFGVDTASIDLLWFINGARTTWSERARTTYHGRGGRPPRRRHSDHAARRSTVALAVVADGAESGTGPGNAPPPQRDEKAKARRREIARFEPRADDPAPRAVTEVTAAFAGPADQPYALTVFGDTSPKRVDWLTRAALEEAEHRLGYRLTVVQGSYNGGRVRASGGTHDGGGVVDLLAWDWRRKVTVLRELGFAAWHRPACAGLWGEHIHAVLVDHGRLAPSAAAQVVAYRAGRDGLKGNRPDDFPRPRPVPVFAYPPTPGQVRAAPQPGRRGVGPLGSPYPPRRTLDGVDISHHQSGRLDLVAARAAGVRWIYVKATEGSTFADGLHRQRVREARSAGLPVGAYHFARPEHRDAVTEARWFLDHVDLRAGDMVPMLDLEDTGDLGLAELTEWTGEWVRAVVREIRRRRLAGRPVIYTPFNLRRGFGCLLWVARYSDDFRPPVVPRPWRRAAIWQHSNGRLGPVGAVPGLGRVDVNAMHPDLPLSALRLHPAGRRAGSASSGTPAAPVRPVPPPIALPADPPRPPPVATAVVPDVGAEVVRVDAPADVSASTAPPSGPTVTSPSALPTVDSAVTTGPEGAVVVHVTVAVPAPAPPAEGPDLGLVEEQLLAAARSLQGAIDSLTERSET